MSTIVHPEEKIVYAKKQNHKNALTLVRLLPKKEDKECYPTLVGISSCHLMDNFDRRTGINRARKIAAEMYKFSNNKEIRLVNVEEIIDHTPTPLVNKNFIEIDEFKKSTVIETKLLIFTFRNNNNEQKKITLNQESLWSLFNLVEMAENKPLFKDKDKNPMSIELPEWVYLIKENQKEFYTKLSA